MTVRIQTLISAATALIALTAFGSARATVITFEDMTGPNSVDGSQGATTITENTSIGNVSFSGGTILTGETNLSADQSSVYYDSYLLSPASGNTITVTFPTAVSNFAVDVYNGELATSVFTVANNLGDMVTDAIPANTSGGYALVSIPQGGTSFTITDLNPTSYDLSIDNVTFDQAVPEPGAWALMLVGFGLAGAVLRSRSRPARTPIA